MGKITRVKGFYIYLLVSILFINLFILNYTDVQASGTSTQASELKDGENEISNITYTSLSLFGDGLGTELEPYIIMTAEQLDRVREYLDQEDIYFKLGADIDLGVAPWNSGEGWNPIGSPSSPFKGNFDGDGHTITNLYINRPFNQDAQGLFGAIEEATITNLKLGNVNIETSYHVGALAGNAENSTISNIRMSTEEAQIYISGKYQYGGLIGRSSGGEYDNIRLKVNLNWNEYFGTNYGGLIGLVEEENHLNNIHITGSVSGHDSVGGLIGGDYEAFSQAYDTTVITNSSFKGNISFAQSTAGGLMGQAVGKVVITDSYVEANIHNPDIRGSVGGIIGRGQNSDSLISRTFFAGSIKGANAGGISGDFRGRISESYVFGEIEGSSPVGGISGSIFGGTIEQTYALFRTVTIHPDLDFGSANHGRIAGNPDGILTNNYAWEHLPEPYPDAFDDRMMDGRDGLDISKADALSSLTTYPNGIVKDRITFHINALVEPIIDGPEMSLTYHLMEVTNSSVTITATITSSVNMEQLKWAVGNKSVDFFHTNGTPFSTSFIVNQNGVYTVYAKDVVGNEVIRTITINNIDTNIIENNVFIGTSPSGAVNSILIYRDPQTGVIRVYVKE